MNLAFNDTISNHKQLYPFTALKSAADIRLGILTIREKWAFIKNSFYEEILLVDDITLQPHWVPSLDGGLSLLANGGNIEAIDQEELKTLMYPWQIFQWNDWAIRKDFRMICFGRQSEPISSTNKVIAPENIFIEPGAIVEHAFINASEGPIYIGKDALVMEGAMLRGPIAICNNAVVKMGAKIYGATTIGPHSVAGGEIKNSVLMGYCNKAHDGYLGDSVIGEWCNLGAGTSNSNVKNTAGIVKVWHEASGGFIPVGLKAGVLMGDYSRTAINTSINTGTVIGICCNIFDTALTPKKINDFTWGKERYQWEKVLIDIKNWKSLKNQSLTAEEEEKLHHIYYH
ncbi:MAG: putative sugar nucleotidyl transferase [Ferruginibacter sp.]